MNWLFLMFLMLVEVLKYSFGGLPPTIKVCHRSDPRLNECIIESIKLLQPRIATGDLGPGLQIPPQEPIRIDDIALEDFGVKTTLKNLTLYGGASFHIDKLRADLKDLKMEAILIYPKLEMTGNYIFQASFLGSPIRNEGDLRVKITNAVNKISIQMSKVSQDGKELLKFDKVTLKIKSSKPSSIEVKNAFGSRALNEIAGVLARENPLFSADRFTPYFEKALSESLSKVANNIIATATFDEVFPL